MVTLAPTSVSWKTLGRLVVVLLPQIILRDMRGFAGFTTLLQQQQHQSQMPSHTYANYPMGYLQVSFSFRVEPPVNFFYYMLAFVMVFAFCIQVPMLLPCSSIGSTLLRFVALQAFRVCPLQAYLSPCDGLSSMSGVPQVPASPTASSRGSLMLLM